METVLELFRENVILPIFRLLLDPNWFFETDFILN
jgi:hypothetical protein